MKGDPYWLTARRDGTCSGCNGKVRRGDQIFYYPSSRSVYCAADGCGGRASRDFDACAFDEAMVAGW
ncbi:MAG TPA: hypothetical protein VF092_21545 [Longimicrobium sp.]